MRKKTVLDGSDIGTEKVIIFGVLFSLSSELTGESTHIFFMFLSYSISDTGTGY